MYVCRGLRLGSMPPHVSSQTSYSSSVYAALFWSSTSPSTHMGQRHTCTQNIHIPVIIHKILKNFIN